MPFSRLSQPSKGGINTAKNNRSQACPFEVRDHSLFTALLPEPLCTQAFIKARARKRAQNVPESMSVQTSENRRKSHGFRGSRTGCTRPVRSGENERQQ